jgi:hypothetical protein
VRYAPDGPILLATDYPPETAGGGAVILRSLVPADAWPGIVWASAARFEPRSPSQVSLQSGSAVVEGVIRRRSLTVDILLAARLAREIGALAEARNARAIWIVMHGAMVHVAARLLREKTLPVHLTVHDDPRGVALMSRRQFALLPFIARDFAFAMRRATSVDTVSEPMAARYRRSFGIQPIVVHRGTQSPVEAGPPLNDTDTLEVGVLGNSYDFGQLMLLARVVEQVAARVGRRGRVTVVGKGFGERLRAEVGGRTEIEVVGHLDEPAAVDRLRRSFALYLNYPFTRRTSVFRQTSFPTKLSTYLMAARPLVVHSPLDSSVAEMKSLAGYVSWWGDETVESGITALTQLLDSPTANQSQHVTAEELRLRYYDAKTNREKLWRALDGIASGSG